MLCRSRTVWSVRIELDPSARHRNSSLNHLQFVVHHRSISKPRQGTTVLHEEHERFRKIFAGIGRCVIGDELLIQTSVEKLELAVVCFSTALALLIAGVSFLIATPGLIRRRCTIVVRSSEGSFKPSLTKELTVDVVPRMGVFMSDGIAQGHARLVRLMR